MARLLCLAIAVACILALVSAQKATDVTADFQEQIKLEESTRSVIYEVELLDWKNPSGKTFTGRMCNETDKIAPYSCDPLFKYNVEVLRNRTVVAGNGAHVIVNQTCLTWPGKTPMSQWQQIGKDSYDDVDDVEKIGIVRLAPVPEGELQDVILRVEVLDHENERDFKTAIGYFMCILPGTSNGRYMKVNPYELRSEALWSGPMHCFPAAHLDRFLAPYIDFEAQRDQELIVRFRAYHENDNKDTAADQQQAEVEHLAGTSGSGAEPSKPVIRNYRRYNRNYGGGSRYKRSANFIGGFGGFGYPYGGLGFGGLGYGGFGYGGLGYGGLGFGGYGGYGGFPYRSFYGGYPARF